MKRIALACALMACGVDHVVEQRTTLAPEVGAQGVAGATGPAGEAGPAGADGAPGAAGAWEVYDSTGADIATLVTVEFSGSLPVLIWYDRGVWWRVNQQGDVLASTGLFSEHEDCGPPYVLPSVGGRLDSDSIATLSLNWEGAGLHSLIVRVPGATERPVTLAAYAVAMPDGSRECMTVGMGEQPGAEVMTEPAPRWVGPLHLAER